MLMNTPQAATRTATPMYLGRGPYRRMNTPASATSNMPMRCSQHTTQGESPHANPEDEHGHADRHDGQGDHRGRQRRIQMLVFHVAALRSTDQ